VAGLPRPDHGHITTDEFLVSTTTNLMKCLSNWIALRIRVRWRTYSTPLKEEIFWYEFIVCFDLLVGSFIDSQFTAARLSKNKQSASNGLLRERNSAQYMRVLQCVAVCCSVLQCVAVCCSALQCVAVCCSVPQCVAVCYSVLQRVAVCCSVLPCVAVCGSVLQCAEAADIQYMQSFFNVCNCTNRL